MKTTPAVRITLKLVAAALLALILLVFSRGTVDFVYTGF